MKRLALAAGICLLLPKSAHGKDPASPRAMDVLIAPLQKSYPELEALYIDLHKTPELSLLEEKTAAKMASRLEALGFTVTRKVGGHGVVGILTNGKGPTVLIRTDMDALPVEEKTGLPYASQIKSPDGVPVMHACGHDLHMTAWTGAAMLLSSARPSWRGTLVFIAQPAEERGLGAAAMLADGLYSRFPKPDFAITFHSSADLPAGQAGLAPGPVTASVDSVDVRIFGRGGHGAYPHRTVDPVVIGSRTVLALQTLVSREKDPLEPAVITVGAFQAGTKHNVIPDEAHLQITVRAYRDEVRRELLAGIARIARAEAAAAGAPRDPSITVSEGTPSGSNDSALSARAKDSLSRILGASNVVETRPVMVGEDFSQYGKAGVPSVLFWVGTVEPEQHRRAAASGTPLPSLHSSLFAPDRKPSIETGTKALAAIAFDLLARP